VTVVVGWVPRPEGHAALEAALDEVRRTGERVVVVSVPRPGGPRSRHQPGGVGVDVALREVDDRLTRAGVAHEMRRGRGGGAPGDELLETVLATRARLLVIGLRRRHVLGRLITGATAQQLILEAPCDVLSVKSRTP
jgi:nucleotide-binding universal stress UspA family protein